MGPYKFREIFANILAVAILFGLLYAGLWLTP